MIPFLLVGYLACALLMLMLWLWQRRSRRAEIIDLGWVLGLTGLIAWAALRQSPVHPRQWLVAALFVFWGARLGRHLWMRYLQTPHEDPRYAFLRETRHSSAAHEFFWLFQFEAVLIPLLAWPVFLIASRSSTGLDGWDLAGTSIWLVGMIGEAIADHQLHRFKKKASSKEVCQDGLWRFSRHPNYFFEWLIWVSLAVLAWPSQWGWIGIIAPLMMWVFLRWITGVPIAEAQSLRSRGEAYRAYQRTTSPFFPLPPRLQKYITGIKER